MLLELPRLNSAAAQKAEKKRENSSWEQKKSCRVARVQERLHHNFHKIIRHCKLDLINNSNKNDLHIMNRQMEILWQGYKRTHKRISENPRD